MPSRRRWKSPAPRFEKATEHKLVFTFRAAAELKGDIEKGAAVDLAILTKGAVDDLIKQGKLAGAPCRCRPFRASAWRCARGRRSPTSAPPRLSSAPCWRRNPSATWNRVPTGIYLKGLFERLGLADELKPKIKRIAQHQPGRTSPSPTAKPRSA